MTQQRLIELEITDGIWRPPQANVTWGLRFLRPQILDSYAQGFAPGPTPVSPTVPGVAFGMSSNPALLYELITLAGTGFYFDLTAYTPPNNGKFPGDPIAGLGSFQDMRTPWRDARAWSSLHIPCKGQGFYGMFASVLQSAGISATGWSGVPSPYEPQGSPNGENFILNWAKTGPQLWRIAAALTVKIKRATGTVETFEVWSSGPDEYLQGLFGDPDGGVTSTGLRIPTQATSVNGLIRTSRYLFMLCGFSLGENEEATITGWRQLLTIGANAGASIT